MDQILKARVIAHGVEEGMHLEVLQKHGLLLIRPLHPGKMPVPRISSYERPSLV